MCGVYYAHEYTHVYSYEYTHVYSQYQYPHTSVSRFGTKPGQYPLLPVTLTHTHRTSVSSSTAPSEVPSVIAKKRQS